MDLCQEPERAAAEATKAAGASRSGGADVTQRVLFVDLSHESFWALDLRTPEPLLPASVTLLPVLLEVLGRDVLVVGRGPLGGHAAVGLATATLSCVSPQSGGLVEAKVEGPLGAALCGGGLDAVVLFGRASRLLGIHIAGDTGGQPTVSFEPAASVSGRSTWHTRRFAVRHEGGTTVCIGPPGEAQQYCASAVVDDGFPTTMGGVGSVLGRLGVKFLRLGPSAPPPVAGLDVITEAYTSRIPDNPLTRSQLEPPGFGIYLDRDLAGYVASGGFSASPSAAVEGFRPDAFLRMLRDDGAGSCPSCPQGCLKSYLTDPSDPLDGGRVHQLGITAFVSQWGDPDPERAVRFNSLCHEIGAEHLYVVGLLIQRRPVQPSGELSAPVEQLVSSVLTDRLTTASLQIKGMAIPPFDPRASQGLGVAMALNPAGPRYDVVEHDIDFDASRAWERHVRCGAEFGMPEAGLPLGTLSAARLTGLTNLWSLWSGLDALGVCVFASPPTRELRLPEVSEMVQTVTGGPFGIEKLLHLGRLRLAVQRHTNQLLGTDPSSDTLPDCFFATSIAGLPVAGSNPGARDPGPGNAPAALVVDRADFQRARTTVMTAFSWDPRGGVDAGSALGRRLGSLLRAVREQIATGLDDRPPATPRQAIPDRDERRVDPKG